MIHTEPNSMMPREGSCEIWLEVDACRLCGSRQLEDVLDLGIQPPANSLRRSREEPITSAPLKLVYCMHCSAVQLTATVDPAYLFSKYVWVTATSATARTYSEVFCNEVLRRLSSSSPFVVEIASNDGTFLSRFKDKGCNVLGVDPAANIASAATAAGIPTLAEFFDERVAASILTNSGRPQVIIARNVLPHVKEIHSIIKGLVELAGSDGTVVIEFHYAKAIVDELHYDSIYHEHLFYFSLKSLFALFEQYGLLPVDAFASPISGGSLVVFFTASRIPTVSGALQKLIDAENEVGLNELSTWLKFGRASEEHAQGLKKLVDGYAVKEPIIAYGASARSSTLMNFAGISSKEIEFVIDRNHLKHGLFTPGTDIPIASYESAQGKLKGRDLLLLAWNFEEEVVGDLRAMDFKGDIIVPLPNTIHIR